ncbi:MAG: hypothetical protein PHH75_00075 [Candidatus Omnitrophica bacterium]|nr:hypothetical protein [Candidatus Omnitrophota bacterium]MDD5573561.1 hypothetical protein [Candidatus Omnitrophota bacterium]
MRQRIQACVSFVRRAVRQIWAQKTWWLTSLLLALLIGLYAVLYAMRYERTAFLYSLF